MAMQGWNATAFIVMPFGYGYGRGNLNDRNNVGLQTGIIFFKDYWLRDGERSPTGDHIDLWNMDRLTPSWQTFARFTLGIGRIASFYSDLENSRSVMFWPIT